MGLILNNLGTALEALGRLEEARGHYQEAVTIARELGQRSSWSLRLSNLGLVCGLLGEVEAALAPLETAAATTRELADPLLEVAAELELVRLLRRRGSSPHELLPRARAVVRLATMAGARVDWVEAHCELGHLLLAGGMPASPVLAELRAALGAETLAALPEESAPARLLRAQSASERGAPLIAGECPEDLPERLRDR
ncbi:MAG: tetratricopeptide repeat protein [Candidatus Schekmanbacteria bacterium]|nr:tetratricopeptide repeat protein [Candidatus Schekmanbacteria bacterium]